MRTTSIPQDKIGVVIGGGGRTIRELQEQTGTEIHIDDEGNIVVASDDAGSAEKAIEIIEALVKDVEVGEIYEGTVKELLDFGALVEILPGKVGLMHISEVADEYVEDIGEWVQVGDKVKVKVLEVGRDGKISLSKKALEGGSSERKFRSKGKSRNNSRRGKKDFRSRNRKRR
jgi:polyribonucleotide nucleotidyltransferase